MKLSHISIYSMANMESCSNFYLKMQLVLLMLLANLQVQDSYKVIKDLHHLNLPILNLLLVKFIWMSTTESKDSLLNWHVH